MRLLFTRTLFGAFAQLLVASCLFAETVTVGGLSFVVDSIQPADGELVRVKVLGHETLVAKDETALHVAREYFTSSEASDKFTQRELESFIISVTSEHLYELASLALNTLIKKPGVNNRQLLTFVDSFAADKDSLEVIKRTLIRLSASPSQREICASLAVDVLGVDSFWLREHLASWFFLSLDTIRPLLVERYNKLVLSDSRASAQTLLTNWREMVGADDATFLELNAIDSKVRSLSERIDNHDIIGATMMVDFNDTRPVMHDLLVPMYISAAEQEASRLLEQGKPNVAIVILARIDFMRRTPTTHQLMSQAVAAPNLDLGELLQDPSIRSILRLYAEKDQVLGQGILASAERFFRSSIEASKLGGAEEAFALVRELRPDPDRANGQMRLDLAAGYLSAGDRIRADQNIDLARSMIATGDYLRVFILILRSDWIVLSLLLMLLLGTASLIYFKIAPFFARTLSAVRIAKSNYANTEMEDELDEELPRFVQFSGTQGNPDYEEYRRCLAFFELEPEATLSAIKSSYRAFVKEHHPDAHDGDKSNAAKEEFRKALETYNRILELRRKFTSSA